MNSSSSSTSVLDRLRAFLRRDTGDGRLRSHVSAARAMELVSAGATLVDVRERTEWKSGHAPQAVHVPLGEIDKATRRLPADKPVLTICASGMRSRSAAKHLRGLGYDAASVSGGMAAWQQVGGAVRR